LAKLLTGLRKIFSFNNKRLLILFGGKYISRSLLYIFFTNNSFASSWIPSNSVLVQSFDFYDKQAYLIQKKEIELVDNSKYSRSIFLEDKLSKRDSIGINLYQTISREQKESYFSIFYKYNLFKKRNKVITLHLPFLLSKSEKLYGIALSSGSSKIFNRKKSKNIRKPISMFIDSKYQYLISNKNKNNIYKIEEKIGISFGSVGFVSESTVEMYEYKSSVKTKINDIRTDVKIIVKIRKNMDLYFGLFKSGG